MSTTHPPSVDMRWGVAIPMRDGVRLNAILYRPAVGTAPGIVTMTPYVAQSCHDIGIFFASKGFLYLAVDVRGRGDSEGEFVPMADVDRDGHDVVEWLARQPFCDGQVAMWGGSYSGYAQWSAIKERPSHLATICPVASPFRGGDSPLRNNIFPSYVVRWLLLVGGKAGQDKIFADKGFWAEMFQRFHVSGLPFRELDTFIGASLPTFCKWLSYPERCSYWDGFNPSEADYAEFDRPILTITGFYDADQPGALMHYCRHRKARGDDAPHYLILGPWDHAGTRIPQKSFGGITVGDASLLDLGQLHVEWYDWTMRGGPRPSFLKDKVAYYLMGADQWRYADGLDDVTARIATLHLASRGVASIDSPGALHASTATGDADFYVYDPRDTSLASLEATVDNEDLTTQIMLHASAGKQLVYESAPFTEKADIAGFVRADLWIGIDQPDTDFRVTLYELDAENNSLLLTSDFMRARYRESLREARLIEDREPRLYRFQRFPFVARRIADGSRLRLVIGPCHSIYSQRNANSGGIIADEGIDAGRPITVRLFHDEARPSALHLPIARG